MLSEPRRTRLRPGRSAIRASVRSRSAMRSARGQTAGSSAVSGIPMRRKTSTVRAWVPIAREVGSAAPGSRSIRRNGMLRRASSMASVSPVGPAPTMRTGVMG